MKFCLLFSAIGRYITYKISVGDKHRPRQKVYENMVSISGGRGFVASPSRDTDVRKVFCKNFSEKGEESLLVLVCFGQKMAQRRSGLFVICALVFLIS